MIIKGPFGIRRNWEVADPPPALNVCHIRVGQLGPTWQPGFLLSKRLVLAIIDLAHSLNVNFQNSRELTRGLIGVGHCSTICHCECNDIADIDCSVGYFMCCCTGRLYLYFKFAT